MRLQLSWEPGRVVAWAGGPGCPTATADEVAKFLAEAEAPVGPWTSHPDVNVPGGDKADAVAAPVGEVLGWLVAAGAGDRPSTTSAPASAGWARSRSGRSSSPRTRRDGPAAPPARRRSGPRAATTPSYSVRWTPALVDPDRLADIVDAMPGSVAALDPSVDARAVTRSALTGMVDAIGRDSAPPHRGARARRPSCAPATTSPRRSSPASTAAPSTRPPASPASSCSAPSSGRARSPATHAPPHRAPRPARPHRRVGPRGVRRQSSHATGTGKPGARCSSPSSSAIVDDRSKRSRPRRRADPPRAHAPRAAAPRRRPPRPGHPEPGRGVGAHDRHRPAPRRRRLRRARARALARKAHAVAAAVRRRVEVDRPSAPTSSPTCAGRRCSTTSSSPRPRSASWPRRPARSSAPAAVGRARPRRPRAAAADALAERADTTQLTGADMLRLALGLEGSPLAGGIIVEGGGWAADLLAAAADVSGEPATGARGLRRRAAQLPGRGARLARLPRRRRHRRLPRPRHGPRQDAHHARPPPRRHRPTVPRSSIAPPAVVGNWAAEAARFTPGLRVRRAPRSPVAPRDRRDRRRGRRRRRRHHHLRHRGARHRRHRQGRRGTRLVLDEAQAIKNPTNDTAQQLRRIHAAHARRAHRHADRERPRRPVGDPRLHQPRPRRTAAAVHRQPVGRRERRRGRGDAPRTRCARAQRHPRVPPHEGRAGDRRRAARPHRRARPLRDDPRADRSLPGRARPAGARRRPARGRGAAQGPDPRRHHRAQADLQPPRRVPGRRPTARRSLAASSRGSRRSSSRCSRPASACWCSPTSPSGACSSPTTSPRSSTRADRLLPRRSARGARATR